MPLLLALESTPDGPPTDIKVINEELEKLREGRRYFMRWVKEFRALDPGHRRGLSPWAFLRAWNDSTGRIVQLLRERRALTGQKEGEFDELMESVYDLLEQSPGVEALGTKQAAAGEDASEPLGSG
jgi:hypothetical protein